MTYTVHKTALHAACFSIPSSSYLSENGHTLFISPDFPVAAAQRTQRLYLIKCNYHTAEQCTGHLMRASAMLAQQTRVFGAA